MVCFSDNLTLLAPSSCSPQDEQTVKLWELYQYEHARTGGTNPVAYHINASFILDEVAYRLEYRWGTKDRLKC